MKKKWLMLILAFLLAFAAILPAGTYLVPVTVAAAECKHEWGETKIKKVTPTEDGYMYSVCKKCGKKEIAMPIPKMDSYKLSKSKFVYDGKVKKPTVTVDNAAHDGCDPANYDLIYSNNKYVGTATMKVKFKGDYYAGTKTLHFTIVPKGTQIAGIASREAAFFMRWNKQATQTTGYQIQYSTSKTFATGNKTTAVKNPATVTKKITGLKSGKTYYVRIRTFKTVDGKNYFSGWSAVKTVKTK